MQTSKQQSKGTKQEDKLASVTEAFNKEKEKTISVPATRMVTLVAESCCGCGCDQFNVSREVPYNSEFQDGDYIGVNLLPTDVVL